MLSLKALYLGALVIMATLLASSEGQRFPGLIGCFQAQLNCFDDDCQRRCVDANFGIRVKGVCEGDPNPNPYNAIDCCCFRR
ncbi:unnamed protein product [Alopecurus aequalis]